MKVVFINKSDSVGGAAVVTMRLVRALRALNVDARMIVTDKRGGEEYVAMGAAPWRVKWAFLLERLRVFLSNGMSRTTLFKVDCAKHGLPLSRHPWVRNADVVCLNWINQGVLSLKEIERIAALGKRMVWTMHDLWQATGVCHLPGECRNYAVKCCRCPLLGGMAGERDLSAATWARKLRIYEKTNIKFVAVSRWERSKALASELLRDKDISVIPNGFPISTRPPSAKPEDGRVRIVIGAARLDDPVKWIEVMVGATKLIKDTHPEVAENIEVVTYGDIRNPRILDGIAVAHRHLGPISGEREIAAVYASARIVLSTSHYETFGATLVEGMSQGCVAVSFDSGGPRDIISHLSTGYLAQYSADYATAAASIAEGLLWAYAHIGDISPEYLHSEAYRKFSDMSVAKRYLTLIEQLSR